jgi:metal-dependent amidase/aminoacylase/carboxypeptidase family protein
MMFHPFDRDLLAHPALANTWVEMRFHGTPAHASLAPEGGASALGACLSTFHLVDAQRVHFRDGVRVHGFVTNGGQAVNIIPEHAAAQFSVRARTVAEMDRVRAVVERCARAAAMAHGVEVALDVKEGYRDLVNNLALARRFGAHLESLGRSPAERDPSIGSGSTDMGDVSHAVPSIHPRLAICDKGETNCHQHAFQVSAGSPRGADAMLAAAKALALTAADVLRDGELRRAVREEFEARG